MNHETSNGAPSVNIGQKLLRAREALKLSREEVARQMRLSSHIIEALEQDDYDHIAAPVYVRGYLRAYAKILQLSSSASNDLLDDYNNYNKITSPLKMVDSDKPEAIFYDNAESSVDYRKIRWLGYGVMLTVLAVIIIWFLEIT